MQRLIESGPHTGEPALTKAEILFTRRCPLRCSGCAIYRVDEKGISDHKHSDIEEAPMEDWYRAIDNLSQLGCGFMAIYGAEPAQVPERIAMFLRHADLRKIPNSVITSGVGLSEKMLDMWWDNKLRSLTMSVDALVDGIATQASNKSSRIKTDKAYTFLTYFIDKYGKDPEFRDVEACMTLTRKNYHALPTLIQALSARGIWLHWDLVHADRGQPYSKVETVDDLHELIFRDEDKNELRKVLEEVKSLKDKGCLIHPSKASIDVMSSDAGLSYQWQCCSSKKEEFIGMVTLDVNTVVRPCLVKSQKQVVTTAKGFDLNCGDVQVGDWLMGYDVETHQLKPTQVQEVQTRVVSKWIRVLVEVQTLVGPEIRTISCTEEHPFYVKGQWVDAKDLIVGSEIQQPGELVKVVKRRHGEEFRNPPRASVKCRCGCGTSVTYPNWYVNGHNSNPGTAHHDRMMGDFNPMKNPEVVRKVMQSEGYRNPKRVEAGLNVKGLSKPEKEVLGLIQENNLPIVYASDKFFISDGKGSHIRPDFKVVGQQKLIEVWVEGYPWFGGTRTEENYAKPRKQQLENLGFEVLMLCVNRMNHPEILSELRRFVGNGARVLSVEVVNASEEVINYRCLPYNNFFVAGVLSHNCDDFLPPEMDVPYLDKTASPQRKGVTIGKGKLRLLPITSGDEQTKERLRLIDVKSNPIFGWELSDRWEEYKSTVRNMVRGYNCRCSWSTHQDAENIYNGEGVDLAHYIHRRVADLPVE
jgi:MoaA/NifB/PqqE/SkfB family radical SAM enzyme